MATWAEQRVPDGALLPSRLHTRAYPCILIGVGPTGPRPHRKEAKTVPNTHDERDYEQEAAQDAFLIAVARDPRCQQSDPPEQEDADWPQCQRPAVWRGICSDGELAVCQQHRDQDDADTSTAFDPMYWWRIGDAVGEAAARSHFDWDQRDMRLYLDGPQ